MSLVSSDNLFLIAYPDQFSTSEKDTSTGLQEYSLLLIESLRRPELPIGLNTSLFETAFILASEYYQTLPPEIKGEIFPLIPTHKEEQDIPFFLDMIASLQNEDGSWSSHSSLDFLPDKVITTFVVLEAMYIHQILPTARTYNGDNIDKIDNYLESFNHILEQANCYLNENVWVAFSIEEQKETFGLKGLIVSHSEKLVDLANEYKEILDRQGKSEQFITGSISIPDAFKSFMKEARKNALHQKTQTMYDYPQPIHCMLDLFKPEELDDPLKLAEIVYSENKNLDIFASSNTTLLKALYDRIDPEELNTFFETVRNEIERRKIGQSSIVFSDICWDLAQQKTLSPELFYYIKGTVQLSKSARETSGLTPFYPTEKFVIGWAFHQLLETPLKEDIAYLFPEEHLVPIPQEGMAITEGFLTDVDTTATFAMIQQALGQSVNWEWLDYFYDNEKGTFRCYKNENRISPSANIRTLLAITRECKLNHNNQVPVDFKSKFDSVLNYLLEFLDEHGDHFEDKWHMSDLYPTHYAVELFIELLSLEHTLDPRLEDKIYLGLEKMIQYILQKYKFGSGGFSSVLENKATIEETSYAIRALNKAASLNLAELDEDQIKQLKAFLQSSSSEKEIPLWIAKTMHGSYHITESARIMALALL